MHKNVHELENYEKIYWLGMWGWVEMPFYVLQGLGQKWVIIEVQYQARTDLGMSLNCTHIFWINE